MALAKYDSSFAYDQVLKRGIPGQVAKVVDAETGIPVEGIQDLEGRTIPALVSNSQGYLPPFQVENGPGLVQVQVGSVSYVLMDLIDTTGKAEEAKIAANSATTAANEAELDRIRAEDAAGRAEAPTDLMNKNLIEDTASLTNAALSAASVFAVADAANQTIFVTPRGNDGNNGLTPKTAKSTLAGGIAALGGAAGTIQLGYGTTTVTGPLPGLPSGTLIQGGGRNSGASLISFTGTGTLFKGTPGTRSYNHQFRDILVIGPGKTSNTVAFDLEDMSQARFDGVTINLVGLGIHHRSQTLGGAVYNTFIDMLINSCGTGVRFDPAGSNGSRWFGVKFGANNIAVDILDSNQNSFLACQFEVNSTAIRVDATLPGTSDNNVFYGCRFELNTVPWNIVSSNVRDMVIDWPAFFGAVGTPVDNGTRTRVNSTHPSLTPPGGQRSVITRGGSYTVGPGDEIIFMSAHGTTATLPAANSVKPGRAYVVKNIVIGPSALVTVASAGGTIDGAETVPLSTMSSIALISNGTNWFSV